MSVRSKIRSIISRVWVFLGLHLYHVAFVSNQGSTLLSVSSYQLCYNIVPNANRTADGTTSENRYIGCENPDSTVTTLDIRLVAGTTSNEVFNVELSVVPVRGANRQTTNGRQCQANPDGQEDCSLVTPAQIQITGSRYVYFYKMRASDLIVPQYCYVGRFDVKPSCTIDTSDATNQHIQYAGTVKCLQNTHVQYCKATDGTSCDSTIDDFADPVALSMGDFSNSTRTPSNYKNAVQDYEVASRNVVNNNNRIPPTPDAPGSCRDTFFSYDGIRKGPPPTTLFNPISSYERFTDIERNDYPTIHSFPISDPPPLGLQSKINTEYGDVLQNSVCGGFSCGGGYSGICYDRYYDTVESAKDATAYAAYSGCDYEIAGIETYTGPIGVQTEYYSLGPECRLWEIDPIPEVLLTVDITVNANFSDGMTSVDDENITVNSNGFTSTQTFQLTNLMGYQEVASVQGVAGARVLTVDTANGYIGPALKSRYMIMCGRPNVGINTGDKRTDYSDPREIYLRQQALYEAQKDILADDGSRTGAGIEDAESIGIRNSDFIDMVDYVRDPTKPYDPTFNPWGPIMEINSDKGKFYPTGENLNTTPLPNKPKRDATFQMIPENNVDWINKGCNGLGMTDLIFNTNFRGGSPSTTTGLELCYVKPTTCIPGYTNNSFGGRSIPPCLASAAYTAAELNDPVQYQYNGDVIEDVLKKSLPDFYDPTNPNYWTTVDPSRGYGLVFDPSTSDYPQVPLSIELLIDLVGEFISEESVVPNGEIVDISCLNGTVNDQNVGNVTIENRGTRIGSYVAQIVCPDDSIEIDNSELVFPDVTPGMQSSAQFFYDSNIDPDDFPTADPCIVELLPAAAATFSLLDAVAFSCTFQEDVADDVDPPIIPVNPLEPPDVNPCGCFDFQCHRSLPGGKSSDSPCYYILIILFITAGSLLGISILILVVDSYTKKHRSKLLQEKNKEQYEREIQKEFEFQKQQSESSSPQT